MNISVLYIKRLTLCCCLLACTCCLYAQGRGERCPAPLSLCGDTLYGDSLHLHFGLSSARIDSAYRDNPLSLQRLDLLLADSVLAVHLDTLDIRSYTSPDGSPQYNDRMARRRSEASRNYLLRKYPYLDPLRIRIAWQTGDWEELHTAVESDPEVPSRSRVLAILSSHASPATKQANLKLVDGGAAYRYLCRHYLPQWRKAVLGMTWMPGYGRLAEVREAEAETPGSILPEIAQVQRPASPAVLAAADDNVLSDDNAPSKDSVTCAQNAPTRLALSGMQSLEDNPPYINKVKRPLLAVKTNLLFDLALMPNIEVEVPIRNRWSLNAELMFPWWLFSGDKYCLQILMGGLEGRYWLGSRHSRENREVLTGHFLGLYAGGGKYDLQWDRNGYQGEFFIAAGISYGYAHKIARNLRLEYNIGIGLLRTDYRHYHARDNYQTLLWQENGKYTWLGPTKAKISLVWLLNRQVKVRKGGVR